MNAITTLDNPVRLKLIPTAVDEVNVRIVAGLVLLLTSAALVSGQYWLYAPLAVDFASRALGGPRVSVLAHLAARRIRPLIPASPRPVAYAPKRFAAAIGAVMTTAATALAAISRFTPVDLTLGVQLIGVLMVVFPFLEAAFAFCVGCKLYALLARTGVVSPDVCIDCTLG